MRRSILALLFALALAGCGGGGGSSSSPSATNAFVPAPVNANGAASVVPRNGSALSTATPEPVSTSQATPAPPGATAPMPLAPTATGTYTDANGSFPYVLYVSSKAHAPFPLVLALHGCLQHPADFEAGTRWFEDAEANGYAVVMPAHATTAITDPNGCWQYWSDHYRGRGEPAVLAGLVREIQQMDGADAHRTYVAGLSSGALMASALAADYPDVFAAIGVASGSEYQPCSTDDIYQCYLGLTNQALDQDPTASGHAAYGQDPSWSKPVPALLMHGDADTVVPIFNLQLALTSLATMDDGFASKGAFPGTLSAAPNAHGGSSVPGGYAFDTYTAAGGNVNWVVVHGMNHAWSGGLSYRGSNASDGNNYNDPKGPNATVLFRTFFFGCSN